MPAFARHGFVPWTLGLVLVGRLRHRTRVKPCRRRIGRGRLGALARAVRTGERDAARYGPDGYRAAHPGPAAVVLYRKAEGPQTPQPSSATPVAQRPAASRRRANANPGCWWLRPRSSSAHVSW